MAFESSVRAGQTHVSAVNMPSKRKATNNLRGHYDFSGGTRGKYTARYAVGTNVVVLAPDLAEAFPDSKSVNEALRSFVRLSEKAVRQKPTVKKRRG